MTEYSRMAKGSYTVSGGTLGSSAPSVKAVNLPFVPDYVELINLTQSVTPANHGIPFAYWDAQSPPVSSGGSLYDTIVQVFNATPVLKTDSVLVGSGISTFSGGLAQQFGPAITISSVTAANPVVVTTSTNHGYSVGTTVVMNGLYNSGTPLAGMPQIAGIPFTITAVTSNTFTIKWDGSGSNYTAYTSAGGATATVRKVLYPFLYLPQDNVVSAVTTGSTTTIVTTMYHNFETGQEIAFRIPSSWGTTQLNSLPNVTTPGSPIYAYVTSVTDNWTFVCNVSSSSYTAFNPNQTVASVVGLSFPQVLSVGDVNTGGNIITATSPLYPSPQFPTSSSRVPSINGPAIRGAFVNNTSQGFIIGAGDSKNDTSSFVGGSNGDIMEWRAYLHDYYLNQ